MLYFDLKLFFVGNFKILEITLTCRTIVMYKFPVSGSIHTRLRQRYVLPVFFFFLWTVRLWALRPLLAYSASLG
jgi:hypothetical protein